MNKQPLNSTQGRERPSSKNAAPRRSQGRLRLPFDDRPTDIGTWTYDHRRGLLVLVIVYLLVCIVFVAGRITVNSSPRNDSIVIDLETLAALDEKLEQLKEENERLMQEKEQEQQWSSEKVRNLASNNALDDNYLKDDRGTNVSELNASAERIAEAAENNRTEYERRLREIEASSKRVADENKSGDDNSGSQKVSGRVTVSYSFENPVRHDTYLPRPSYKCQGSGRVVVSAELDRTGKVVAAKVVSGTDDECMKEQALQYARRSAFDINNAAPVRQSGTITYEFIAQ